MAQQPNTEPTKLPKLRSGVSVAFNDYDVEGKPQWLIHDSGRNKFFLIGWLEYEILERWDLGAIDRIVDSINKDTTLEIDEGDVNNFLDFLKRNYLIVMSGYEIHKQAKDQNLFKKDNTLSWLISNYLFFRIPLFRPDAFLTKTSHIARFIFSKPVAYVMIGLAAIAFYQLTARWDDFINTSPDIFNLQGLFFGLIAFLLTKLCHELGHAYMCRFYNIPVPTLGVAFLVFWPVLYTDTTLSWALNNRERLRIAIAGIWVETYIMIITLLIWCNTDNVAIKTVCYINITINWMASLLINASPFMRFDGYYILADYLKMPNLQPRAFALTRWQIRRVLFGWTDPPPERFTPKLHLFFISYSLFTWIYRLIIYFGIAILVYYYFAKVIGIILFLIEIYAFILAPLVTEVKTWLENKDKFTWNINTKITTSVSVMLIIAFFLPLKSTYELPATLSYTHQFLYAPEAGILESPLPPLGTEIEENQPITTIKSVQLEQALYETQLEYNKTVSQLRRSAVNPEYTGEKNVLLSDLKKLRAEYQKLLNLKEKLVIKVPFDGVLVEADINLHPGSYIMKDQWIGDVIKPNSTIIEAFAAQIDISSFNIGATGYFYAKDLSIAPILVKVASIEPLQARKLECQYSTGLKQDENQDSVIETPCYNASELGGGIAAYQGEQGGFVPTTSVYRVVLTTDEKVRLHHVQRENVLLESKPQSYAFRTFYSIKTILIEELGF